MLEVTARSAADVLEMQANTTMLFYRKVRHLIAGKLAEAFPEHGEFEVDESYFGGVRKGKRGRGAAVRFRCLASSSAAARFTPR